MLQSASRGVVSAWSGGVSTWPGGLPDWGCLPGPRGLPGWGGLPGPGGLPGVWGICLVPGGSGIPARTEADTLPPVDRHTPVKTLPWPQLRCGW